MRTWVALWLDLETGVLEASRFHYYMNLTITVEQRDAGPDYDGVIIIHLLCAVCFF